MRILCFFFVVMTTLAANSQLYVGDGGLFFVRDSVLTVTADVEITASGNLYLRGHAQLLQKTAFASQNKGDGGLSIFQEGTSNQYKYNYWCSPVGGHAAASGNSGFGITQLHRPTGLLTSSAAEISELGDYDGTSDPLKIAQYWIWKFQAGTEYAEWIPVFDASDIQAGEGFTMKGVEGVDPLEVMSVANNPGNRQRYDFRGRPNDGTIPVTVGEDQYTLTGNPYPSAFDVTSFLLDPANAAIDGTAIYWEQKEDSDSHFLEDYIGGYGVFVPIREDDEGVYSPAVFQTYNGDGTLNDTLADLSGSHFMRRFAPIGQGFMVRGGAAGTVYLKNSHRAYIKEGAVNNSEFARTSAPRPAVSALYANGTQLAPEDLAVSARLRLNVRLGNGFTRQTVLVLHPEATLGADHGMDARNPNDEWPIDSVFHIGGLGYVVQSVPFSPDLQLPLLVKTDTTTVFRFWIAQQTGFDGQEVYLYDDLDGSYHDISDGFYEIAVDTGIYSDRFQLRFFDPAALGIQAAAVSGISIYQDNRAGLLRIDGIPAGGATVRLYDMAGRDIGRHQVVGPSLAIPTDGFTDGVYVVRLTGPGSEASVRKIIIRN